VAAGSSPWVTYNVSLYFIFRFPLDNETGLTAKETMLFGSASTRTSARLRKAESRAFSTRPEHEKGYRSKPKGYGTLTFDVGSHGSDLALTLDGL
jgi:hypothetical protein